MVSHRTWRDRRSPSGDLVRLQRGIPQGEAND
jgi:hypothetical protein